MFINYIYSVIKHSQNKQKPDENPNLLLVKNHDRKPNVVRLLSNVSDSQKEI
jgi:hypothetical protein